MRAMPAVESHQYPLLPSRNFHRRQSVVSAIELADSDEIRRAFQFTFQRIRPAMIRTAHLVRVPCGFSHDRGGVMTADIEETTQRPVVAAHDHDRPAGDFGRDEISRFWELIDARGKMPRPTEDHLLFKFEDPLVRVP